MVNITHKSNTLRQAIAGATVKCSASSIDAIKTNDVPKGNVLESARIAALFAIKKTSDVIPDCHPVPVEFSAIRFNLNENEIQIEAEVHTIYKTGVEVEAMHGASVAALTIYDMLKPIDKSVEICSIKLLDKKGGKTQYKEEMRRNLSAAIVVCSDSISQGEKEDFAGKAIEQKLKQLQIAVAHFDIIPDESYEIQQHVKKYTAEKVNLLIFCGGTGISQRDVTPEAIRPLLEKEIPGVAEMIRSYGQQRTPYSMLSRSVAGLIGETLVLALPGSTKGASESMDALFPHVLHVFRVLEALRHEA